MFTENVMVLFASIFFGSRDAEVLKSVPRFNQLKDLGKGVVV